MGCYDLHDEEEESSDWLSNEPKVTHKVTGGNQVCLTPLVQLP